jgi:hypothetical protein
MDRRRNGQRVSSQRQSFIELNKNVLFIKLAVSLGYVGILTAILLLQNKQY